MIAEVFIFFAALVILAKASKMVIDSSLVITEYTGLSQLSIGFIVIALAVAMPDFMVVVTASIAQKSGLAIGDALGSSIANICLVLGIATLIRRVDVERRHMLDSAELLVQIAQAIREGGVKVIEFTMTTPGALDMIKETKGYRVLQGMRGEKQKDIASLAELLVQVSQLAARYPQIKEIDLNPIRVYENGYSVLDARILLYAK